MDDNEICNIDDIECINNNEEYNLLKDFVNSDELDIYTATAIILKNYNQSGNYIRWVIIASVCLITQLLVPIFVTIDIIQELKNESSICPSTGPWQVKATSFILSLLILVFYIRKWEPLISRFIFKYSDKQKPTHAILLLFLNNLEHYMSETIFNFGLITNMITHCINTCTGLFIIFSSKNVIDMSINCMALYYFNEIIMMVVDDNLKSKCGILINHSRRKISSHTIQNEITYKKIFDSHISLISSILMIILFPIISISVFLAILGGLIYFPLCHP